MTLDVTHINIIENTLLTQCTQNMSVLITSAQHLLYYFIAFEIILAGFSRVFFHDQPLGKLFSKIIKIGIIISFIQNFPSILHYLINYLQHTNVNLENDGVESYLLNPGLIWEYSYNFAIGLLKTAATQPAFAYPMILITLGFGILLVFGIFGIQICLQLVSFYLVALLSLIFLPLSVFSPCADFFARCVKSLLQASVRLTVQTLLVFVAVQTWSNSSIDSLTSTHSINYSLGLLYTGLLFVIASAFLPRTAEKIIGNINWGASTLETNNMNINQISAVKTHAESPFTQFTPFNVVASTNITPAAMSVTSQSNIPTIRAEFLTKQNNAPEMKKALNPKILENANSLRTQENIQKIKEVFQEALSRIT